MRRGWHFTDRFWWLVFVAFWGVGLPLIMFGGPR